MLQYEGYVAIPGSSCLSCFISQTQGRNVLFITPNIHFVFDNDVFVMRGSTRYGNDSSDIGGIRKDGQWAVCDKQAKNMCAMS